MPDTTLGDKDASSEITPAFEAALHDRYVLETEVGSGAMGIVWKARDVRHDRTVCIKVLRSDIARMIGRERFHREIQTSARLMHPGIVTVLDSGEADGQLYYVMPYIDGESLRSRISRAGTLPVDDAIRITRMLAQSLQHAHRAGVVHRDVKPENILLSHEHAWLVDFGIARAAATPSSTRLTSTGAIIGSPQYVSPEQARGEEEVDGRSDIYSLGCVLYEMLTGHPPFEAATLEATLLGHLTKKPAPIRAVRGDVSSQLEQVVMTMLAKRPEDRFADAGTLADTLAGQRSAPSPRKSGWKSTRVLVAAVGLLLLLGLLWRRPIANVAAGAMSAFTGGLELDTTRYVVMPFVTTASMPRIDVEQQLSDALAEWSDIDVLEQNRATELRASTYARGRLEQVAPRIARKLGAGRFITGSVARTGDSLRVHVELHDGNAPLKTLARARVNIPANQRVTIQQIHRIAAELMLSGTSDQCARDPLGTRSLAALHACDEAFSALQDGDLARADSVFVRAGNIDGSYARVRLWHALSRGWVGDGWRQTASALREVDARQLSPVESVLLRGERLMQAGQFQQACQAYDSLLAQDSLSYAVWLGAGECRRRDQLVVPTRAGGMQFRSSYAAGIRAYSRAFELHPALLAGYRDRSFLPIRELFKTSITEVRSGFSADSAQWFAYPSWVGDSLAFVPVQAAVFAQGSAPPTVITAVDHQRNLLYRLTSSWAERFPQSSAALEALAVAQELGGDDAALATIESARRLALSPDDRLRTSTTKVWLLIKFGAPARPDLLKHSQFLADSLIANAKPRTTEEIRSLAALAVLIGRGSDGARLIRSTASAAARTTGIPAGVLGPARALSVFAALGAPTDSMRHLEEEIDAGIRNLLTADKRVGARRMLLTQAAMIAYPTYRMRDFADFTGSGFVTDAELAHSRNDFSAARGILDKIAAVRRVVRPSDLTLDALLPEAWLLAAMGDSVAAFERVAPTLDALRWTPPGRLSEIARAGTLVRAFTLRADLSARADAASAARWARAVTILWADADESLQPVVKRMRNLTTTIH